MIAMLFQALKRYPLLTRLTLMLASLGTLSYALFLSAGLSAHLSQGIPLSPIGSTASQLSGIHLIQIILGLLFLLGCLLTLKTAQRTLVERTDLALRRSHTLATGAVSREFPGGDEVDRLALALEKTAACLRGQLADQERNANLARAQERFATRSLEFIYRTSLNLTEHNLSTTSLQALLEDLADSLQARNCTLHLQESVAEDLAAPPRLGFPPPEKEQEMYENVPWGQLGVRKRTNPGHDGDSIELTVPVRDSTDIYGALSVEIRTDFLFESRQGRVVETVGGLLALSLGNLLRNQRRRRLALMDERNAIAGELHDSLAQALAYMKIQVARLQKELEHSCNRCGTRGNHSINEVATDIRTGLDSAYRHLRELLTAFRTNMPPGGLQQALREVVDELAARADTDITLDYHLGQLALSVNEEFHILQIVREALTNVVRHARARHARVGLEIQADRAVEILVEDDGRGVLNEPAKEGHYGLSIMQDRALQLGGSLQLSAINTSGTGTRVRLLFLPQSQQP